MGPRTDARLLAAPAAMVASVVVGEAGVWHGLSVSASDIIEVNLAQGFEVIVLGLISASLWPGGHQTVLPAVNLVPPHLLTVCRRRHDWGWLTSGTTGQSGSERPSAAHPTAAVNRVGASSPHHCSVQLGT